MIGHRIYRIDVIYFIRYSYFMLFPILCLI